MAEVRVLFACIQPRPCSIDQTTPQPPKPHLHICYITEPIILELCLMLMPLKCAPIILKSCKHNWSKPNLIYDPDDFITLHNIIYKWNPKGRKLS